MFFIQSAQRTEGTANLQKRREVSKHNENTYSSFYCADIKSDSGKKKKNRPPDELGSNSLLLSQTQSDEIHPRKTKILQKETELMRISKHLEEPEF